MAHIMSRAQALDIIQKFKELTPKEATSAEVKKAMNVSSAKLQVGAQGVFLRLLASDGRTVDLFLNPAATMLIATTLLQTLQSDGWLDDEGLVTSD